VVSARLDRPTGIPGPALHGRRRVWPRKHKPRQARECSQRQQYSRGHVAVAAGSSTRPRIPKLRAGLPSLNRHQREIHVWDQPCPWGSCDVTVNERASSLRAEEHHRGEMRLCEGFAQPHRVTLWGLGATKKPCSAILSLPPHVSLSASGRPSPVNSRRVRSASYRRGS
jgi:hypothetical protein